MAAHQKNVGPLETWEPKDKSFTKHTIVAGSKSDDEKPNDGSVCTVNVILIDNEIDEVKLGLYKLGSEVEVTVGESDTDHGELLDRIICSMSQGEECYVKTRVDSDGKKVTEMSVGKSALKFKVKLISVERAMTSCDLEPDERLDRAQHQKDKGTALYTDGNLKFSIKRFKKSLAYLRDMELDPNHGKLPALLANSQKKLSCQCHLNLGACYLREEKWQKVIIHCSKAIMLEPNNVKGHFRRGQGHMSLQEYTEAKEDFIKAKELEPKNNAVITQLSKLERKIQEEKNMYKKMFT